MSAYASLPGSFLPPFFAFGGASATATTEKEDGSEPKPKTEALTVSMPSNKAQSKTTGGTTPSPHSVIAFSALTPSPNSNNEKCSTQPPSSLPSSSLPPQPLSTSSRPSDIIIAFQSARVDPVQLIKSLTSRGTKIARRTANFIARTPSATGDISSTSNASESEIGEKATGEKGGSDEVSVQSAPQLCYEDSDSDDEYSMYDYSDDFSTPNDDDDEAFDDLHDEADQSGTDRDTSAIEFELAITFNGRKYNATRAFPTFVKLRNDLVREYNVNEGDCHRRSRRNCGGEFNKGSPMSSNAVPELPRVSPESLAQSSHALSGVARSGFALLQATAQHYCPEMEGWMRQVIDAFPCSQSLSRFLWEPLSSSKASWESIGEEGDCNTDGSSEKISPLIDMSGFSKARNKARSKSSRFNSRSCRSLGSCSSLDSIEEGDGYDSADDHST